MRQSQVLYNKHLILLPIGDCRVHHYTQLSMKDRCRFGQFLKMGLKIPEIAERLKRHRSTLYRELARNKHQEDYSPGMADRNSRVRRIRPSKIQRYATLRVYVVNHLKQGWSPEQIAGRLKRKKSKYSLCHETIYQYVYKKNNKQLYHYLAYKKPKRYLKRTRKSQVCRFGNRRIITERPQYIDQRVRAGHWEGDCIEFAVSKKNVVTTLVERKSRMLLLIKNDTKKSDILMGKICQKFMETPERVCHSITFDQGNEFARFLVLEKNLKCTVYYCHTRSPWEKGSNENMNGRLRWYLPSSINIHNVSQEQLDQLARRMNNIPRKCLAYRTPKELFLRQYKETCRTWL